MTHANKIVLVAGASGKTGQCVVESLRRHGFAVRVLVREGSPYTSEDSLVEVIRGNITLEDDARRVMTGASYVISTLGSKSPTDVAHIELIEYATIAMLAQLARELGVQQFVMCSSMGVEIPDMIPPLAEILRQKRRGELALETSGMPFTIVRPGGLTDTPGGQGVMAARTLHGFGVISRADVAEVLVQALLQMESRGKIVEIVGSPDAGPADRPDLFASVVAT